MSQTGAEEAASDRSGRSPLWRWLALAAGLALICAFLFRPGSPLYAYELKTLDLRFQLRSQVHQPERVAVIAIDERSINELGQWPWDRRNHAALLRRVAADGPRAIAFDVIFSEASTLFDDTALTSACASAGNVFLSLHTTEMRSRVQSPEASARFAAQPGTFARRHLMPTAGAIVPPLPELAKAACGGGAIAAAPDPDGVIRRMYLFVQEVKTRTVYPTLLADLLMKTEKLPYEQAFVDLSREARLGPGWRVPLDSTGRVLINYLGPTGTIRSHSYVDVMRGKFGAGDFRDRVVLIGFTAPGMLDAYPTPVSSSMPGVEVTAQALESLLQHRLLTPAQFGSSLGWALVLAVLAALAAGLLRPATALAVTALIVAGFDVASLGAFTKSGAVWPTLAPNLAGILTFGTIAVFRLATEEAARKRLRDEFGRYAPPEVVARLDAGEMKVRAAGVKRPVTALFADVRGFTAWSATADPHDVVAVLNTYYESVTQLAFDVEGTIDNIVGDEIFVTFNAIQDQPDHAERAVDLAINMMAALDGLNERWLASGTLPNALRIGIGIHTGEALVGSLGSHVRTQYTCLGQTINLAARLQALNKDLGTTMLTTREVADKVAATVEVRSKGMQSIRGHPEPVEVWEIVGRKSSQAASGAVA